MKKDTLDRLIQLAFLEGEVQTHGAWENKVARETARVRATPSVRRRLEERLEAALPGPAESHPLPETVGSHLRRVFAAGGHSVRTLAARLGLTEATLRMLEQDRLSPLRVPADRWRAFMNHFSLGAEELAQMILQTHRIVLFRPAVRTTLARYRAKGERGGRAGKAAALEAAAAELYIRAGVPLPPGEERKIMDLVREIGG